MEKDRFHKIGESLKVAYGKENWVEAEELSWEYLDLAKENTSNWNYGNAIHHANLVLGKIRLENGNVEQAKDFLLKACKTIGSPQLNSFGPNMSLAAEFLELGENEVVLEYLGLIRKFWNPIFSFSKVRKWKNTINEGRVPDFGANRVYHLNAIHA